MTNGLRDAHLEAPRSSPVKAPIATPAKSAAVASPAKAPTAKATPVAPVKASGAADQTGDGELRPIDPTKPLHKQSPPVCNAHLLAPQGCKRDGCPCVFTGR